MKNISNLLSYAQKSKKKSFFFTHTARSSFVEPSSTRVSILAEVQIFPILKQKYANFFPGFSHKLPEFCNILQARGHVGNNAKGDKFFNAILENNRKEC